MYLHVYSVIFILLKGEIFHQPKDEQEDDYSERYEEHNAHVLNYVRMTEYRLLLQLLDFSFTLQQSSFFSISFLLITARLFTLLRETDFV